MSGLGRWKGKVAVVTGASAGIGADLVQQLCKNGIHVVGLARRSENIQKLSEELKAAGATGKLYAVKCDLSKESDILAAFEWTEKNVGPISILVNNAGLNKNTTLVDGDSDKWRHIFDVNVIALLICTREAVKSMKKNNIDGHIVNVNSIAGHYHLYFPGINVYPATKHAVTNLTETLRKEFNENKLKIKVTSVSPGAVTTEFIKASGMILDPSFLENMPFLAAEDVSEGILYALSTKPHVQVHEILLHPVGEQ